MNQKEYWDFLKPLIPRILGQLDRDPDSPTYGSFDRNFWNYKIRDFSSAIIQQGILVLDVIYKYKSEDNPFYQSERIKSMVEGSINYWTKIQLKTGSFNEYYPHESGFPPTGFSLYAVSILMDDETYNFTPGLQKAIEKAAKWILKNPEKEALNQEAVALSGICIAMAKAKLSINNNALDKRLDDFYNAQSTEGWFNEYDGPDIGYLAVTVDCLTDVYRITKDERARNAIVSAVSFINKFVTNEGFSPVMINSRNTDYIVPYGIFTISGENNTASQLAKKLINQLTRWDNQLYKTDDRYLCHYIGQSFFRSLNYLPELVEEFKHYSSEPDQYFDEAGIFKFVSGKSTSYISLRKGGVINVLDSSGLKYSDFGFRIKEPNGSIAVSHWQDIDYAIQMKESAEGLQLEVNGVMRYQKYLRPSPLKHIILRIISRIFGNTIIPLLKKQLIFRDKKSPYSFTRKIILNENKLLMEDDLSGIASKTIERARHYSMRHVSSAGRFCMEELKTDGNILKEADFPLRSEVSLD